MKIDFSNIGVYTDNCSNEKITIVSLNDNIALKFFKTPKDSNVKYEVSITCNGNVRDTPIVISRSTNIVNNISDEAFTMAVVRIFNDLSVESEYASEFAAWLGVIMYNLFSNPNSDR